MSNHLLILAIERDCESLKAIAASSEMLMADNSPMPDGNGTVANRFDAAVKGFEASAVQMFSAVFPGIKDDAELELAVKEIEQAASLAPKVSTKSSPRQCAVCGRAGIMGPTCPSCGAVA